VGSEMCIRDSRKGEQSNIRIKAMLFVLCVFIL
jgi:hypothetical protein